MGWEIFYWFPLFPYWLHGNLTSQTEAYLKQLESACILVILTGHPQILKKNSLNFIHCFYCLVSNKWNDLDISHRCLCYFMLTVGIAQMLCVHELFGLPLPKQGGGEDTPTPMYIQKFTCEWAHPPVFFDDGLWNDFVRQLYLDIFNFLWACTQIFAIALFHLSHTIVY